MHSMRRAGRPVPGHHGIKRLGDRLYLVRAKIVDERTGKKRQRERMVKGTLREASKERARLVEELRSPRALERPRVGEFAKLWSEAHAANLSSGTRTLYESFLELHILPALGDYYLDALRAIDLQAWIASLTRKLAPTTIRTVWALAVKMIRTAVAQLDLPRDPTLGVVVPEGRAKRKRALTAPELGKLLAHVKATDPELYALAAVLAFTGLRTTHVIGLRWDDIDEVAGVFHIRTRYYKGDVAEVSRMKRAPESYPLLPELARILRDHRERLIARQAPGLAEGWVFAAQSATDRPMVLTPKRWGRVARGAGFPDLTPHGLRYTWKDLARLAGVDAVVSKALVGHTTDEIHAHYSTVRLDEGRAAARAVLRLVPGGKRR
jgi:integrase